MHNLKKMYNLKKMLKAGIRVAATNIRLGFGKLVHGGKLKFSPVTCLALSDEICLSKESRIDFGKRLRTRGGCVFNVQDSGELRFGFGIFLNKGCQFNCRCGITVGDGCEFGPNALVYDHDHKYQRGLFKEGDFLCDSIQIGSNCWIGANVVILRGTKLGDGCVIAAGSVVKGEYPAGSLILQKRETEIRSIA